MKPITCSMAGPPGPSGAHWDGEGVNFALFSEHAEKVELCLFDASGRREVQRIALRRAHRPRLALLSARGAARAALRLSRARPVQPEEGHRFNPHKLLLDPYARSIVGRAQLERRALRLHASATSATICRSTAATARAAMPKCRSSTPPSLGRATARRDIPWHRHGDLRAARARLHRCSIPTCRQRCAAPTPGSRRAPVIEHLQAAGRHRRRAAAGARVRRRPPSGRQGPAQLLGLQHDRLLRARGALLGDAATVDEFKTMVKTLHAAGHRGDPRRRLQPHGRRQPARARRSASAASTTPSYYRLMPDDRRYYMRLHRLRQHAQHAASARAAADHGLACATG